MRHPRQPLLSNPQRAFFRRRDWSSECLRLSCDHPAGVAEWQTQGTQNPPLHKGMRVRLPPPAPSIASTVGSPARVGAAAERTPASLPEEETRGFQPRRSVRDRRLRVSKTRARRVEPLCRPSPIGAAAAGRVRPSRRPTRLPPPGLSAAAVAPRPAAESFQDGSAGGLPGIREREAVATGRVRRSRQEEAARSRSARARIP